METYRHEQDNKQYWMEMAKEWGVDAEDAKMSRCGNCAAFDQEESMLNCIAKGIGDEGDPWGMIEAGDLGYCEIFDFTSGPSFDPPFLIGISQLGLGVMGAGGTSSQVVDLTSQTLSISIRRGRDLTQDKFNPGTATVRVIELLA